MRKPDETLKERILVPLCGVGVVLMSILAFVVILYIITTVVRFLIGISS